MSDWITAPLTGNQVQQNVLANVGLGNYWGAYTGTSSNPLNTVSGNTFAGTSIVNPYSTNNSAFDNIKGSATYKGDNSGGDSGSWWNGGTLGKIAGTVMNNLDGIAGISNSILGWKQYAQNRKLINKQMENIDEQIAASKEYRQQRRDEIARLNRIRNNTQKSFNTGTTITRSY